MKGELRFLQDCTIGDKCFKKNQVIELDLTRAEIDYLLKNQIAVPGGTFHGKPVRMFGGSNDHRVS